MRPVFDVPSYFIFVGTRFETGSRFVVKTKNTDTQQNTHKIEVYWFDCTINTNLIASQTTFQRFLIPFGCSVYCIRIFNGMYGTKTCISRSFAFYYFLFECLQFTAIDSLDKHQRAQKWLNWQFTHTLTIRLIFSFWYIYILMSIHLVMMWDIGFVLRALCVFSVWCTLNRFTNRNWLIIMK